MKAKFLLDADWTINYLQGERETVARVQALLRHKALALSIVSLAELYEGVIYSDEPALRERVLRQFLRNVRLLPLDRAITRMFGRQGAAAGAVVNRCT